MTTQNIFASMLTENTGRHFLDSGGAYGRHWERNQGKEGKDFDKQPMAWVKWDYGFINFTISTYHFLREKLHYEEEIDTMFQRWMNRKAHEDMGYLQLMEAFPAYLAKVLGRKDGTTFEPAGLYGDGSPMVINTYNEESNLDQVIQYVYFTLVDDHGSREEDTYVLLQVHGGCDVRGGYTAPRVFSMGRYDDTGIFDHNRGSIHAVKPDNDQLGFPGISTKWTDDAPYWCCDGGSSWGYEGCWGCEHQALESYEPCYVNAEEYQELLDAGKHAENGVIAVDEPRNYKYGKAVAAAPVQGYLCFDEDGNMFCPITGWPLEASFY